MIQSRWDCLCYIFLPLPLLYYIVLSHVLSLLFLFTVCCCCCCCCFYIITYLSRKTLSSFAASITKPAKNAINHFLDIFIYAMYIWNTYICARCDISKAHSGLVCTHLFIIYTFFSSNHTVMGNWMAVAMVIAKTAIQILLT